MKKAVRMVGSRLARLWWRVSRKKRLMILMYHRVLPLDSDEARLEQPGMVVSPKTLESNLEWLSDCCKLVDLRDWVRRSIGGDELPDLAAAITFDDGWADNFQYALPVLKRCSAPATIFICPAIIETGARFWPNRLALILASGVSSGKLPELLLSATVRAGIGETSVRRGLQRDAIDLVISEVKAWSDGEIQDMISQLESQSQLATLSGRELLTWSQAQSMQDTGLVNFGSHTRNHLRMRPGLDRRVLEIEILDSRLEIEGHLKKPVAGFAYPNGDVTCEGLDVVRRGYEFAVTTRAGSVFPGDDVHLLRRIGIHEGIGAERWSFMSRLLGIG